tara:strand:- start:492 stop:671 length:180 start_codon:yes stop_codon:yes gene_type:complete
MVKIVTSRVSKGLRVISDIFSGSKLFFCVNSFVSYKVLSIEINPRAIPPVGEKKKLIFL